MGPFLLEAIKSAMWLQEGKCVAKSASKLRR